MTLKELTALTQATSLTPDITDTEEISCGYTCDLLSWVMAHGKQGMAWVTVQIHMNVIAVASLSEMACVILPENIVMEEESLQKARDEGIPVLTSPLTAFDICGRMAAAGLKGPVS